ncbi:MAG: hypothetical protein K2X87_15320 [Gemmataceae bacterium]|nr:hypothetical protein [Gemmataceae bacterium]
MKNRARLNLTALESRENPSGTDIPGPYTPPPGGGTPGPVEPPPVPPAPPGSEIPGPYTPPSGP